MKEEIYISFISGARYQNKFIDALFQSIKHMVCPEGVSITNVEHDLCFLTYQILRRVCITNDRSYRQNANDAVQKKSRNKIFILKIEVETPYSLKFKKLEWLEKNIKQFVCENEDDYPYLYINYLLSDESTYFFRKTNILKHNQIIVEDYQGDDFTYLDSHAEYIKTLLYEHNHSAAVSSKYPVETALLLLLEDRPIYKDYIFRRKK